MVMVSVIIPCYNHGKFIDDAVESVLNQTFQDFEIIIIDDGSTDTTTIEKLSSYSKIKTRVFRTANQGLSLARNFGVSKSDSELILFLDSDNKLVDSYLLNTIQAMKEDDNIGVVYTDAYYFGNKNGVWKQGEFKLPDLLLLNQIDACVLMRRTVFNFLGGFRKNMKYGWEDWDLWLTAYDKKVLFKHFKKPLFYYRVVNNSLVHNIENENFKKQYLEQQLILNHIELYKKYFPEPLTMLRELDWLKNEKDNFEKVKKQIYNSLSYRLGDFLLKPFKFFFEKVSR